MAENSSTSECICRNVRLQDAILFYMTPEQKKPDFVWHKDCPVHPFIISVETKPGSTEGVRKAEKSV